MTRIQRRLLIDTSIVGVALTFFVAILDSSSRALRPLDDWFYDRRAQLCQRFTPPPTDKLIHVDIDDQALVTIGQWPWPRTWLAEIIDEIDRAGAKAIAMDVIFSEPSNPSPRIERLRDGKYAEIDDDANFAAAVLRSGKVLVPVSLKHGGGGSPLERRIYEYLLADLELGEKEIHERLLAGGGEGDKLLPDGAPFPTNEFVVARREAVNARISREFDKERRELTLDELRRRLLPRIEPDVAGAVLLRVLAQEHRNVQAVVPLRRFALPATLGDELPPLARYVGELAPIPPFSRAATYSGFVNYVATNERGVVRSIPLVAEYRGKLFPQMDLVLACAMLGVDVRNVKLSADKVVIPRPPGLDRDIEIPVRSQWGITLRRRVGMMMDVPVRGKRAWETLYDHGRWTKPELHLPIAMIWDVHMMRQRLARNNQNIDKALSTLLDDDAPNKLALDPARGKAYREKLPDLEALAPRRELAQWTRKELRDSPLWGLAGMRQADLSPDERLMRDQMIDADRALGRLLDENARFEEQVSERRKLLRERIGGRAVMIGWTFTGGTDSFPTAIQPDCPGSVIHGLAYNAIMTGEFWRHAPRWVNFVITVFLGLAVTAPVGYLRTSRAFVVAVLLAAAYLLVNGLLLFDYYNVCVGVAGPICVLGLVWSTGSIASLLIEAAERARITRRFSSWVDKRLVDYVIEHPEMNFDGELREMSVVFTDLAGFTTMTESLRERSVPILSEYLGTMVPIIRRHEGVLDKFMGDGIMFFFNAPRTDPAHAVHAVTACLEMQAATNKFADMLVRRGLPRVSMRCGVSTGTMVVGNSGPVEYSDYTVLGDNVNFAARLESANKATGTSILISERTVELLGDRYLVRQVGKLQVVGKSEGVMSYEPLAPTQDATPEQRLLCETTRKMVDAYVSREFAKCVEIADELDRRFGVGGLTALYRCTSKAYLENPPAADFAGNLVLTEK